MKLPPLPQQVSYRLGPPDAHMPGLMMTVEMLVQESTWASKRLGILFHPVGWESDEERNKIMAISDPDEQAKIYEASMYPLTHFYEGSVFGLNYAHTILEKYTGQQYHILVTVTNVRYGSGGTNDCLAAACCFALWELFGFQASIPPYYDNKTGRFIFPESQDEVPSSNMTKKESFKLIRLNSDLSDDEIAALLNRAYEKPNGFARNAEQLDLTQPDWEG